MANFAPQSISGIGMSRTVRLRKGLDIKLVGEADKIKSAVDRSALFAVKPTDFHGVIPKMVVKVGEKVKAGTPLFSDKYRPSVQFVSPVSGEVKEIVRGEKRRILEVHIKADTETIYEPLEIIKDPSKLSGADLKSHLLSVGLWPLIKMRPIDVIAQPEDTPKAIFISAFDSSPLAPDYDFILHGRDTDFQTGLDALIQLTDGKVHLITRGGVAADQVFTNARGVEHHSIFGKHPVGNVGTQIHHIDPINKGEVVWTVNPQDVAMIGRVLQSGKFDSSRVVALTGSEIKTPRYIKTTMGTSIQNMVRDNVKGENARYISGNVLTGEKITSEGFLGFYDHQITVIPEGDTPKLMITKGWMGSGAGKFSINRSYFSWLTPRKERTLDTNLNGEERAFVVTGEMEKVFPFDIYPMQLVKSILYKDIDLMENLGIYEIAPEDFALCEFVCSSKTNLQAIIREGLDVVQRECM